jgi:hypothetical protein
MHRYGRSILLALLVIAPVAAQTPATEPVVRGCFKYGDESCKKRCGDDMVCFKECTQHCLTPEEVRDVIKQQSKK